MSPRSRIPTLAALSVAALSVAALSVAALSVAACQPAAENPRPVSPAPWNEAGSLIALIDANGVPAEAFHGVWQSRGYGWIFEIDHTGLTRYQAGESCYVTPPATQAYSAMASVDYRYGRLLPQGQTAIFQLLPGDTNLVVDRLESLPDLCRQPTDRSPSAVASAFLDHFETHYAFVDQRLPDRDARAARLRETVTDTMSEGELWDALAAYMDGVSDSHTRLIGLVDGQRRRQQDGQGTTLPFIRGAGGERDWLMGLLAQATDNLGDGATHTLNERLLSGIIEPEPGRRVGYLQLFVMGGFTDRTDFASDTWAAAELAAFNAAMDDALTAFQDVDAVIVDLSNNRGGWDQIAKALPGHFSDTAFISFTTEPQGAGLAPYFHIIPPAEGARFTGPVRLLTSDVTVSGGELATLAFRQLPNVTHYGTATRGSFSTPLPKPLPNGWLLELSNEVFAAPDGRVFEETGIPPQVELDVFPQDDPVAGHWRAVMAVAED